LGYHGSFNSHLISSFSTGYGYFFGFSKLHDISTSRYHSSINSYSNLASSKCSRNNTTNLRNDRSSHSTLTCNPTPINWTY
jgi:hypothetical protein